jgi:hypothetical protein
MYLVGSGAGFSGDRVDAPRSVVDAIAASGKPGAIIFETIGERTLALGHVARRADPNMGYEPLLADLLGPILADCVKAKIAIVGNFGVANPQAAARVIRKLAENAGIFEIKIAIVQGDDIREDLDLNALEVWEGDKGLAGRADQVSAANVYIGAKAIADALVAGAQVVVTSRVADPSLVLGPLVAHYGWKWDDWNLLACGTLAGHLLECGSQITGGYFADPGFKDVPGMECIGFPIAEIDADGSIVITKPSGTGGLVDLRTVKEQILYEIHDPSAYLTPDVVLDITSVEIEEIGPDRVAVRGARGMPAPERLKATICFPGDWLGEAEISYSGPNAMARAKLAISTIDKRLAIRGLNLQRRYDLIGAFSVFDGNDGPLRERALNALISSDASSDLRVRLAVSSDKKPDVDKALQEVLALYCCGPAGGGGVRTRTQNRIRTVSYMVPRTIVNPSFEFLQEGE